MSPIEIAFAILLALFLVILLIVLLAPPEP